MRESQVGFSKRSSQSTASFNPFPDSSRRDTNPGDIKPTKRDAKYRYTPRFILDHGVQRGAMTTVLRNRIGHAKVEIRDRRRVKEPLLRENWVGTVQVNEEEALFVTDNEILEPDKNYHVVYEKVETPIGEAGIKIHEVIS